MTHHDFGSFRLSSAPLKLRLRGKPVELRSQALRLLLLLVENRGRVVSHEEIRQWIWGNRAVDHVKAIPLLVRDVRDALMETATDPVFLETVPREGYKFAEAVEQPR
ncbi:MAG: transcriptional regulator [Qingshengfaniella sp.]